MAPHCKWYVLCLFIVSFVSMSCSHALPTHYASVIIVRSSNPCGGTLHIERQPACHCEATMTLSNEKQSAAFKSPDTTKIVLFSFVFLSPAKS